MPKRKSGRKKGRLTMPRKKKTTKIRAQETDDCQPSDKVQQFQPKLTSQGNTPASGEDGDSSACSEPLQRSKRKKLKDLEFEKIMDNPATRMSAWNMFMKVSSKKRVDSAKPAASCSRSNHCGVAESTDHPRSKILSTPTTEQVDNTTPTNPEVSQLATPEENDEVEGEAMVNEILNRYQTNKMKALRGKRRPHKKNNPCLVDLDDDDDLIWGDDPSQKSDFSKYLVPQYELKEKLYKMHYETIENMTMIQVTIISRQVIPDLKNIMNGTLACKRHEIFKGCGLSKQPLREMTITKPFTSVHDSTVGNLITDALFSDGDPADINAEYIHYLSGVLIPEAFIRIYAIANSISNDLAEKELRFKADYDGTLSEEVLQTLNKPKVNKENDDKIDNQNETTIDNLHIDENDDPNWIEPDYTDKEWLKKNCLLCQICDTLFDDTTDALKCFQSHQNENENNYLRCYLCFSVLKGGARCTDALYRHYQKRHQPGVKQETVKCPHCIANIDYRSVSIHMIIVHFRQVLGLPK